MCSKLFTGNPRAPDGGREQAFFYQSHGLGLVFLLAAVAPLNVSTKQPPLAIPTMVILVARAMEQDLSILRTVIRVQRLLPMVLKMIQARLERWAEDHITILLMALGPS
ncbi:uncharacterized protein PGTG_08948 [Puccinia graminis f. sp. tritici CRL 75-36-700-3]|uniref:Uncharacterized protein n=1 Tax=Puccinia graminis f. sp. tritici (strain CRL 75-36-700-3 / race SCCL) TaxID=418459 RepID=E3KEP8_PUCGT|nr:uncharacterized protein PGTG_08948 [Puccinia graminis f. sp. tritici CRL 75-36-700-3]EFP82752.1 hypothetical protein PGTG_08948 [Puccinia graminis f. sp. tritici CRL 75-36-700-3]